jgi:hypothetical protein
VSKIEKDLSETDFLAIDINYQQTDKIKTDSIPQSFVFRFYDQMTNYLINEARNENFIKPIKQVDDIKFSLGTSHSIILCGNKFRGYEIIIIQEF